jgi:hypothetical protein
LVQSSPYDLAAFVGLSLVALALAAALGGRRGSLWPQQLLLAGVAFRIVGSLTRYQVLFSFYRGSGDAALYYAQSLPIADAIRSFEVSPFTPSYWLGAQGRWGTGFISRLSGVFVALLGPSLRGDFLVFSLLAFGGLLAIARAFGWLQPERRLVYARWIWLWPSLWFWPSSIGKESVILLAIGLATLGYVGSSSSIRWPLLLAGGGLAFMVRPHVAAVLCVAVVLAEWLDSWSKATPRRMVEGFLLAVLSVLLFLGMLRQFGLERPELEGVVEFVEWQRGQTLQGGSQVGSVSVGASGALLAFVNIWMRPFPWEAHNVTSLIAAVEMAAFWLLVVHRRREVMLALRHWRAHRMLRFSLPLLLAYTLMIGMAFGNLGIIARQRAPIFPFMLLFVLAVPPAASASRARADEPVAERRGETVMGQA